MLIKYHVCDSKGHLINGQVKAFKTITISHGNSEEIFETLDVCPKCFTFIQNEALVPFDSANGVENNDKCYCGVSELNSDLVNSFYEIKNLETFLGIFGKDL